MSTVAFVARGCGNYPPQPTPVSFSKPVFGLTEVHWVRVGLLPSLEPGCFAFPETRARRSCRTVRYRTFPAQPNRQHKS
eukprot:8055356-Pyramimonas_sp.AAC.1